MPLPFVWRDVRSWGNKYILDSSRDFCMLRSGRHCLVHILFALPLAHHNGLHVPDSHPCGFSSLEREKREREPSLLPESSLRPYDPLPSYVFVSLFSSQACRTRPMEVIEFLCDRRFHRVFELPPNPDTDRPKPYRTSYADYGDANSNAVVLFCGALMGTRFCYSPLDQLAKAYNVRIIHPDRPGIGGCDLVDLDKRIQIWLGRLGATG